MSDQLPPETAEEYRARILRTGLELAVAFVALVVITLIGAFLAVIIHDSRWWALVGWIVAWLSACVAFLQWITDRPETKLEKAARLKVEIYATRQAILEMEREHERILNRGER